MLFNQLLTFFLMAIIVDVGLGETSTCIPTNSIVLSNCSFYQDDLTNSTTTTTEKRRLSMIVPYALNQSEEENLLISILTRQVSSKALIRLNLNLIRCNVDHKDFLWNSLEFSSTMTGEFVRTTALDRNQMYLPSGTTYLKNLTSIDCSSKTIYRTDDREIFRLDLRVESTLNDHCLDDQSCSPMDTYRCDSTHQRCACREPYQPYLIKNRYPICIHAVPNLDQCQTKQVRCFPWCHINRTASECFCPTEMAVKRFSDNDRGKSNDFVNDRCSSSLSFLAYCESQTGGICNQYLQCSPDDQCLQGVCHPLPKKFQRRISLEFVTLIVISVSIILSMISLIFAVIICILRRQRKKQQYQAPIESTCQSRNPVQVANDDYENYHHEIQLSISEDKDSSSVVTRSDPSAYEPRVLFLGGEQQLTAIFA